MASLRPYLWPKSVAVIGASDERSGIRGRLTNIVMQHPFTGETYLTSRTTQEVNGKKTCATISDVRAQIDLAVICVPAKFVPSEVQACIDSGVRSIHVVSSGFSEEGTEEGRRLQAELAGLSRRHDVPIVGPNAQGVVNAYIELVATFSNSYDNPGYSIVPKSRQKGRVAIVSQSGALSGACFSRARLKEMPLSFAVATGNEAVVNTFDLVDEILEDDDTTVVMIFMEDVKNPEKLRKVAMKALQKNTVLIVHKIGRSEAGQRAAASHTGALAGSHKSFQAMLRKYFIIEAADLVEMVDIANGFSCCRDRLPRGRGMAILTGSGGAGGMMADTASMAGLTVPRFGAAAQSKLREVIPDLGAIQNPVDPSAKNWLNVGFSGMMKPLLDEPGIDAFFLVTPLGNPRGFRFDMPRLAEISATSDKPALLWTITPPLQEAAELMSSLNIPIFEDLRNAARTMALMVEYRAFREAFLLDATGDAREPSALRETVVGRVTAGANALTEYDSRPILAAYGICSDDARLAETAEEAVQAGARIGKRVALKVQSPDILHKTEARAIKLNLSGRDDLTVAFNEIIANAKAYKPGASIQGVLVQPMAEDGVEVILGVTRDDTFGPMLMVGLGGILVEALNDVAFVPVPVRRREAHEVIRRLKGYRVLEGVRGKPRADIDALVEIMVRLSDLAADFKDTIVEIDLNPVLVHAEGQGVSVVDALIVTANGRAAAKTGLLPEQPDDVRAHAVTPVT